MGNATSRPSTRHVSSTTSASVCHQVWERCEASTGQACTGKMWHTCARLQAPDGVMAVGVGSTP